MDIAGLIERVKAASGPDSDLDVLIDAVVLHDRDAREVTHPNFGRQLLARNKKPPHDEYWADAPQAHITPYTASVDAVLALIERALPGVAIDIGSDFGVDGEQWAATLTGPTFCISSCAATPALALLAAFLEAYSQVKP